jgi:hypothetical protein
MIKSYFKMKNIILILAIVFIAFTTQKSNAQIRLSFNIGLQPLWGPVGYDHVENYYLPEIDSYYNVDSRMYTYMVNGRWVNTMTLPWQYRNYDLYRGYKVVMNESRPYQHYAKDRVRYASYRNQHDQQPIRDSRDQKYFENKNHPQHNEWRGDRDQNNRDRNNRDQRDNRNDNSKRNGRGNGRENEKDRN